MGFHTGAYCTVWETEPKSDTMTKGRISISRKNRQTGEYETDFNGFVSFCGSAAAKKAASLKEKDRIKLGDIDVRNSYDKEKKITYTNFYVFSFDTGDSAPAPVQDVSDPQPTVDEGEDDDERLPF